MRTGLLTFIIIAAVTIPVYLTGLGAEHIVTGLPDVQQELIEAHQRSALFTLITLLAVGLISLGGYYFHRRVRLINPSFLIFILALAMAAEISCCARVCWAGGSTIPKSAAAPTRPLGVCCRRRRIRCNHSRFPLDHPRASRAPSSR